MRVKSTAPRCCMASDHGVVPNKYWKKLANPRIHSHMRMGHRSTHSHRNSHTAVGYRRVQELAVGNPGRRNNKQLAVRSLRLTSRVRVSQQEEQEHAYPKLPLNLMRLQVRGRMTLINLVNAHVFCAK